MVCSSLSIANALTGRSIIAIVKDKTTHITRLILILLYYINIRFNASINLLHMMIYRTGHNNKPRYDNNCSHSYNYKKNPTFYFKAVDQLRCILRFYVTIRNLAWCTKSLLQ